VKLTLVRPTFLGFLLGCVAFCVAQESSPWSGESADVQRLFKFSGTLTDSHGTGSAGGVSVRFTIYDQPDGGEAYWRETQNVRPDARGRYTVLLGETTLGGLPPEIFGSRGRHWLGVRASGHPEQPRILLVELPSAWKPDPITSSAPIRERAILPSDPTERRLVLILLIMFLAGTALAYAEVAEWWKRRAELYGEPPLIDPLSSVPGPGKPVPDKPGPDKAGHTGEMLRFPLAEKFRSIRGRFQHFIQNSDSDRPKKAA
jgi:hypothetical protein